MVFIKKQRETKVPVILKTFVPWLQNKIDTLIRVAWIMFLQMWKFQLKNDVLPFASYSEEEF